MTDSVIERADALGIRTLVKIRVGRCWATGGTAKYTRGVAGVTESGMPTDMSVYTSFVTQVVDRYAPLGVHEYAVENEINSPSFWDGTPADYATLAHAAADAIHQADPSAIVVDSAISSAASGYSVVNELLTTGHPGEALDVYNSYYARRFGTRTTDPIVEATSVSGLQTILASPEVQSDLAFMATINQLMSEGVFQARQVHFYEPFDALPDLLSYIGANTPAGIPLEIWELGAYTAGMPLSADAQTQDVLKATVIALADSVTKVLWLPLAANPEGRQGADLWGLVNSSGGSQGSSDAFAAIAAAARKGSVVPIDCGGIEGIGFRENRSEVFVWSTGHAHFVAPVSMRVTSFSAAGAQPDETIDHGESLRLGSDPVQLTLNGSIAQFEDALTCHS